MMFKKILIANRGEIALRVIAACHQLGVATVAIFSEADREALHVKLADKAYCIGPPEPQASYLNMAAIMSTAEISGAEAIHPGYGFLAEDPRFVEVCEASHIVFIGPPHEIMRQAGDKLATKTVAGQAGIPIMPGTDAISTEAALQSAARELGFPFIIKASAGGGGRGMRLVKSTADLIESFHAARREAEAAFGIPNVYLEKYLERAKHIEVQILADRHGNCVHWGERECSIQRRYQKLIEESPAPGLSPELRHALWEAALKAARALGYQNAGTFEFLVQDKDFYLIEINARVQVEHPISEMRVGKDLIMEQIRLASGERLGYSQSDLRFQGHAFECRINAEDPAKGFMPSMGKVHIKSWPGGPGVRIDSHLYDGLEITPHYDSLLAKVIAHGPSREAARRRMIDALKRLELEGVQTTRELCQEILEHPAFIKGEATTRFLTDQLQAAEGRSKASP
jgi:acetyl-CoA carboxylase biotin carboxylase subunit